MTTGWTPTTPELGSYFELVNFIHAIEYHIVDELTGVSIDCDISVTPDQENPSSIIIENNRISGYYQDSFLNKEIKYLNTEKQYKTTKTFREIDTKKLDEMVYYHPDPTISQSFTYTAVAKDSITQNIVSTQTYTIIVKNSWTAGENALIAMVAASKQTDKSKPMVYFQGIDFKTTSGSAVTWENKI